MPRRIVLKHSRSTAGDSPTGRIPSPEGFIYLRPLSSGEGRPYFALYQSWSQVLAGRVAVGSSRNAVLARSAFSRASSLGEGWPYFALYQSSNQVLAGRVAAG